MNKKLSILGIIIGIMALIIGIGMKMIKPAAISLAGGADGPTTVFLAGKVGSDISGFLLAIGIVLLVISVITLKTRK